MMNGNNGHESFRTPFAFCPICLHKLYDAIGPGYFSVMRRYEALARIYTAHKWEPAAKLMMARHTAIVGGLAAGRVVKS